MTYGTAEATAPVGSAASCTVKHGTAYGASAQRGFRHSLPWQRLQPRLCKATALSSNAQVVGHLHIFPVRTR
jgi:hypothetical protein